MLAFQDELEKQAIVAGLARGARSLLARQGTTTGAGAAVGGLLGGGVGAALGGGAGYSKARGEGATRGEAAQAALGGAWKGLKGGATVGALGGAAGGLTGGAGARGLAAKLRGKENILGKFSRFGERQVHGVTGYVPQGYGGDQIKALRSMRGGAYGAAESLKGLEKTFKAAPSGKARESAAKKLIGGQKHMEAAKKTEEMGITSLPGYLKALAGKGKFVAGAKKGQSVGKMEALKGGLTEQWRSTGGGVSGAAMKGLIFGLPTAGAASEVMRPSEAGEEGRFARAGRSLGGLAYGLAPLPLAGMHALSRGLESGGAIAGKGLQKVTGIDAGREIDPKKIRHARGMAGGSRL